MKKQIPISNTKRQSIAEEDWNFSRVPDNELVPCLLWEFLRESPTARQLAEAWAAWSGHMKRGEPDNQSELWKMMEKLRFKVNAPLNLEAFKTILVGAWAFEKLWDIPWQKLSPGTKAKILYYCMAVNPPVFVSVGDLHVGMLHKAASKAFSEACEKTPDGGTLTLPPARTILPYAPRGTAVEAFCVVVDWGRYDNEIIKDAFAELGAEIAKTRPKGIIPQKQKGPGIGKGTELRGKLNSLGHARLRGFYKAAETLRTQNRAAYNFVAKRLKDDGFTAVQKSLGDARRRFKSQFREILQTTERPLCLGSSSSA